MRHRRSELALHLLKKDPDKDIDESVMGFFEDLGALQRRGRLDEELTYDAFSYHVKGWWLSSWWNRLAGRTPLQGLAPNRSRALVRSCGSKVTRPRGRRLEGGPSSGGLGELNMSDVLGSRQSIQCIERVQGVTE
jgi:hypothetical protein